MRINPTRSYETVADMMYDPEQRYRQIAQSALNAPDRDFSETHFEDSDGFDPDLAVAFARVAQYLDSLPDDPAAPLERAIALDYLTGRTHAEPLIDTEEGQVVRLRRGPDGQVAAVTVTRADGGPVSAMDLRFPFRLVKDFDAVTRLSAQWVDRFNLEHSVSPAVRDRAEANLRKTPGLRGDARYQRVAELYLEAEAAGFSSKRRLIMSEMDVDENYAGVLISRARQRGYLPPVTKTTKGNT